MSQRTLQAQKTLTLLFVVIGAAAVLGAIIVKFTGIRTGMLGPLAGAATILLSTGVAFVQVTESAGIKRALVALPTLCVLGFLAELSGLRYNTFGEYRYTDLWWPIHEMSNGMYFPFLVPLSWFFFITSCYCALPAGVQGAKRIILSGVLAAAIDFCLEPVLAGPVRFWVWAHPVPIMLAPLQNSSSWAIVTVLGSLILWGLGVKPREGTIARMLLIAILFFSLTIGLLFGRVGALASLPMMTVVVTMQIRGRKAAPGDP